MTTEHLIGEELALLQNERGTNCISIIVPTHKLSPERRTDILQTEKIVQKAKEYVLDHYTTEEAQILVQSIDQLYQQIDFTHNAEGLGLFVSKTVKQIIQFHFPVKERIAIGNSFEIRDILYEVYYQKTYFLLSLVEKGARLYQGNIAVLHEIKNHHFPLRNIDQFEYNPSARGSSYTGHAFNKQFERDKSQMEEMRYDQFLKTVDDGLKSYLINHTPLIVAGPTEDVAAFKKINSHQKIIGEISGNQFHRPLPELALSAWEVMKSFLNHEKENQIKELYEKVEEGQGKTGLAAIWSATQEGKGYKLLVEKDYTQPGFLAEGDPCHLHLKPPKEKHEILPDAVNILMQTVLEKKGEVIIVENGRIENYGRIGLITRY